MFFIDDEFGRPTHKVILARELTKLGWRQVFSYRAIYGTVKLWIFSGPDSEQSLLPVTLSYFARWALHRLSLG